MYKGLKKPHGPVGKKKGWGSIYWGGTSKYYVEKNKKRGKEGNVVHNPLV